MEFDKYSREKVSAMSDNMDGIVEHYANETEGIIVVKYDKDIANEDDIRAYLVKQLLVYLTLFGISLLAATLLPGGSEALLLYDISLGYNPLLLILFATIGNTFGSIINYFLGYKGVDFLVRKKYANSKQLQRATERFEKYGAFSLLLSWMPIIGDPITLVAGVLKYDLKKFVVVIFIAKGVRYIVVSLLIQQAYNLSKCLTIS